VRGVQVGGARGGGKARPWGGKPSLGRPSLSQAGGQHSSPRGCLVSTPRRLGAQAVEVQGGHKGPQAAHHSVPGPPSRAPQKGVPGATLPLEPTQRVATKGWVAHPEGGASPACLKNRPPLGQQTVAPRDSPGRAPQRAPRKENETQASPHVTQLLTGHCRANKHKFKVVQVTVQCCEQE